MRAGASLVEVVVAFAVLGVALPGAFAAAGFAAASVGHARLEESAVELAGTLLDSLLRLDAVAAGSREDGVFEIEWGGAGDPAGHVIDVLIRYPTGRTTEELRFGAVHIPPPPALPEP